MAKIDVYNTKIVINDYILGDCKKLENNFKFYDPLLHKKIDMCMEYDEINKKLYIPRGIDILYIENLFNCTANIIFNGDEKQRINPPKLKYKPRNEIQFNTIDFMCGYNKYKHNLSRSQLSINLITGKGKTFCTIASLVNIGLKSIIIVSYNDWMIQWKNCIHEYTDTKMNEVVFIKGSGSIDRLFIRKDLDKIKFIIASHDTIKSYASKRGWERINILFKQLKIGVKVFDEAHLNFDNVCKIDFVTNTFKTFYLTATPAKSDEKQNRIFQLYFKNIPSIRMFDKENDPHTNYNAILYNSNPSPIAISSCKNVYGFDKNRYSMYITDKDNFYNMFNIFLYKALKNKKKNIFYIATNAAILKVYDYIKKHFPNIINYVGIYTSRIPKDKKLLELNKRIILSTTKSLGTASDVKGLQCVFNVAEPFKSKVLAEQAFGRTRDKDTDYYDIIDLGFRPINTYYKYKKPIYTKMAKKCTEFRLSEDDVYYNGLNAYKNIINYKTEFIYYTLYYCKNNNV